MGYMMVGVLQNCFQLGVTSNPNCTVVLADSTFAGGLIGTCIFCNVSQSGVQGGMIQSTGIAGGVAGIFQNSNISQTYVTSNVTVKTATASCPVGGMAGKICSAGTVSFLNCYSNAFVSPGTCSGGFLGTVTSDPIVLSFTNGLKR